MESSIPELSNVKQSLSPSIQALVSTAKQLYQKQLLAETQSTLRDTHSRDDDESRCFATIAPGRVNLIGEHTDYTGGFVLPLAIEYSTVVYGTGRIVLSEETEHQSSTGGTTARLRFVSTNAPENVQDMTISTDSRPPSENDPTAHDWTNYVVGVVAQYLCDIPTTGRYSLDLSFCICGNVPLGSGLSSSASLEVAVARFVECVLGQQYAFASAEEAIHQYPKLRALRCQKAENTWCHSPCGIMDQFVSSAASEGSLLLIDCRSLDYDLVTLSTTDTPSLVIANSNVQHSIGGGEYPARVKQCQEATRILKQQNDSILALRDATLEMVESSFADDKNNKDSLIYRRAKHVVTENARTLQTKQALMNGDWKLVGDLMNASHASMRNDYEVSCKEVDVLVDLAQSFPGVYGSRLTGGGFGGCTVTLVKPARAEALMEHLKQEYESRTGLDCVCFETCPGPGARVLAVDSSV